MNREDEIRSIKEEQRKLADRLERLEKPEKHDPELGDVYLYDGTKMALLIQGDKNVLLRSPCAITGELGSCCHEWFRNHTYLGKFDDVFITKKRVAEMLYPLKDIEGDSIMCPDGKLLCYDLSALRKTLSNEGITEDLLK